VLEKARQPGEGAIPADRVDARKCIEFGDTFHVLGMSFWDASAGVAFESCERHGDPHARESVVGRDDADRVVFVVPVEDRVVGGRPGKCANVIAAPTLPW
jgi:hypothetical protein